MRLIFQGTELSEIPSIYAQMENYGRSAPRLQTQSCSFEEFF